MAMSKKMRLRLKLRYCQNLFTEIFSRPWSDLRGISNSYAAKSTILIPLIGYWVIFNERIVKWLDLAREFVGAPVVDHIPSRILWLYLALCAVALGTFIYALRCPPEVKKYGDYRDYVNGDGPAVSSSTMHDIEKDMERDGYSLEGEMSKADFLEINFRELNASNPYSRWAVTICFVFGFGILAFLSGKVFYVVVSLLFRDPFG